MAELTMVAELEPVQPKKRRRRRKKEVCVYAQKNCTREELQLILTDLDGNRPIMRADDGRRMRTQVIDSSLTVRKATICAISKKERKIKKQLLTNYLERSREYIGSQKQVELIVLPIEQMLALVEVIA